MNAVSQVLAGLCVLGMVACGSSPTGPTSPLNREFTLSPGEEAQIEGSRLKVQFLNVTGDSLCPADVVCILGGDAIIHVRASSSFASDYELHTGDSRRARVGHDGFFIQLVQLQPYPFSSRTIDPGTYRLTLTVSR